MTVAEFDAQHPNGHVVAPHHSQTAKDATNAAKDVGESAKNVAQDAADGVKDVADGEKANGSELPEFKSVQRVGNIPMVADSVQTFENVVKSTQLTASIYNTTCGIAMKSYDMASPILARSKPLVDKADSMVNSGLDMIESRYPYPFKASTGEIVDTVKQPVQGVYDNRIAPIVHTEVVQRAIDQLYQINSSLAHGVVGVRNTVVDTAYSATQQLQALAAALIDQLHHLSTHGKDLPPKIQESVASAYSDVRGIVAEKDKNTQQKASELAHYVQSMVQPEVERASAWLSNKGEQAKDAANDTANNAGKVAGDVANGAQDKADQVSQQAGQASDKAQKEAGRASDKAQQKVGQAADKVQQQAKK